MSTEIVRERQLDECEDVIARGLATFVEVGAALTRIRDERLYRDGYETFEAYCDERWQMSRKRAYDFVAAAQVTAELSQICDTPQPRSEAVAYALAPLRQEPEALKEAWTEALQAHGPAPTAAQVREVVQTRKAVLEHRPPPVVHHCPTCGARIKAGTPRPTKERNS